MKKTLLALATLGLFHTAQAELLEGNVTIQLKLTSVIGLKEKPTSITYVQGSSTYKNANFIKDIATHNNKSFSKGAKLMFSLLVTEDEEEFKIFIRDKGKEDLDITNFIEAGPQWSADTFITKGKTTPGALKIGSEIETSLGQARIRTGQIDTYYELEGQFQNSKRYLQSKEDPTKSVATLGITVLGSGGYRVGNDSLKRGVAKGTVKLTTTKVLPTPPAPPEN